MALCWKCSRCSLVSLSLLIAIIFILYLITLEKPFHSTVALLYDKSATGNIARTCNSSTAGLIEQSRSENRENALKEENFPLGEENVRAFKKHLPNAIIIGSAKAGTRALLVFLKIHPSIRACPTEVHFFDRDDRYCLGLQWYKEQMLPSKEGDITIEKSPAYFTVKDVPRRVHNMSSTVKLLIIVRDPTQRAISDYTQLQSRDNGPVFPTFEKYVTKDNEHKTVNKERGIIEYGVYINHLRQWLKFFPLSQIHFVSGEELVKNPAAEMQLVEKFLELRPVITKANFYLNKTKGFHCLIGKIGLNGKRKNGCLKRNKGRKHVPVKEDVIKLLQDYYRPFNEELYKVVGRNFHWP